jgi:hypothetical protein
MSLEQYFIDSLKMKRNILILSKLIQSQAISNVNAGSVFVPNFPMLDNTIYIKEEIKKKTYF